MKPLAAILCLILASCASPPPRAIIPPPADVDRIETAGVENASKATREAVREIAKAGQETRTATQKLRDEIDRAQELAQANDQLRAAFVSIQTFAAELSAAVTFAAEKERLALLVIDDQESEISLLKSNAKAQAVQIHANKQERETLRTQVEALADVPADLAIAEDKLEWWRKAAATTWIIVALYIAARVLLRTVIPFRF